MNDYIEVNTLDTQKKEISQKVKQIGNYIIGSELGTGAFAQVVLGTHDLTGESVAIKILDKIKLSHSPENFELIRQEIEILKIVKHKNIVQLYEILETPQHIYIVMEFCEGKDLMDYIITKNRLNELEALRLFQELIHALSYLHLQHITHRDVKIDNMLLDKTRSLKLADFGLSTKYSNDDLLRQPCGTVVYAAPEILEGLEYHGMLADVWSSGIVLYGMLAGYLPFCDDDDDINKLNVIQGKYEIPDGFSPLVKDLIKHMLDHDPYKRYTIFEVQHHPWFKSLSSVPLPGIIISKHRIPIDLNIISKIDAFGYDMTTVKEHLRTNKYNSGTALYYLLVKKAFNKGYSSVSDLCSNEFIEFINNKRNKVESRNVDKSDLICLNDTRDTNRKISQTLSEELTNSKKDINKKIPKKREQKKSSSIKNLTKITNYFNSRKNIREINNNPPLTERGLLNNISKEKNRNHVLLTSTKPPLAKKPNNNAPIAPTSSNNVPSAIAGAVPSKQQQPLMWKPLLSTSKPKSNKSRNRTVFNKLNQEDTFGATLGSFNQKTLIPNIPKLHLPNKYNDSYSIGRINKTLHYTHRNDSSDTYSSRAINKKQLNESSSRQITGYMQKPKTNNTRNKIIHTNRHLESSVIQFRNVTPNKPRDLSYSMEKCLMNQSKRMEKIPWKYKKKGIDNKIEKEILEKYQQVLLKNAKQLRRVKLNDKSKKQDKTISKRFSNQMSDLSSNSLSDHRNNAIETIKRKKFRKRVYSASLTHLCKTIENKYYMSLNRKEVPIYNGPIDSVCMTRNTVENSLKIIKDRLKQNKICFAQTRFNKFICTKMGQSCEIELVKLKGSKGSERDINTVTIVHEEICSDAEVFNLYYKIKMKKGKLSSYKTFAKLLID